MRNAIERIFGVVKRRFQILSQVPKYPFDTQVRLVFALTGLHNFIRLNTFDSEIDYWKDLPDEIIQSEDGGQIVSDGQEGNIGIGDDMEMSIF